MSTCDYSENCYFCGAKDAANIMQDTKPPTMGYICYECGMYSKTTFQQMDIEELNDEREFCMELPPLKNRKEIINETY